MNIGAILRDARERRALSVDDLARMTKITTANLLAIQENRRDDLPDDVFLRGFVRAYAGAVGLDPADTVRRYFEQFTPPASAAAPSEADAIRPARAMPVSTDRFLTRHARDGAQAAPSWTDRVSGRDGWIAIATLLVVVALGYNLIRSGSPPPSGSSQRSPAAPAIDAEGSNSPVVRAASDAETTGTAGSGKATALDSDVLHVELRALGPCWVTATVDGTRLIYQLMQPDERRTFDMRRDLVLRVGEPASFAFSINGASGRPLARAGQPVTAHITGENYREFLQP